MSSKWDNDEVIQRFREYLRIPSVHPDIDYDDCVKFLKKQASELDLPVAVHVFVPKKPVVVITWEGLEPELPSILLNSHMDVVPVNEEKWSYPPFDAVISDDGFIYARGTQDMKSIGMMHLEAVRKLKAAGVRLKRTIHITFVPDEEIGSEDGMRTFSETTEFKELNIGFALNDKHLKSQISFSDEEIGSEDGMRTFSETTEFKELNIGFALDESAPNPKPKEIIAFVGEKTARAIVVTCRGEPGHGSLLQSGTAGEKLYYIIDKFMSFRAEELKKTDENDLFNNVTTINLTQLSGGVQINVLPETLSVWFDIRIAPDVDHDEFDRMISRWCEEAGDGVSFEYLIKNPQVRSTKIDGGMPFWNVMNKVVANMGFSIRCVTCPGATDLRYVRSQGIPAINFSPLMDTPILVHGNDEKIHIDVYMKGIDIIEKVVEAVANV